MSRNQPVTRVTTPCNAPGLACPCNEILFGFNIMSAVPQLDTRREKSRLYWEIATTIDDIRASQALRYRVFAGELGAQLHGADPGIDDDRFDGYCQHLLVRDTATGRVIGSTRLLLDGQAAKAGGFYSAT